MSNDDEQAWLDLRAAALARPREVEGERDARDLAFLFVRSAGGRYAVDLRWLRAVRTLRRLARLPLAPPQVVGLVSHDGVALPVFHLAATLGAPLTALPERAQALVLGVDGDQVAVAVDEIAETRALRGEEILPPPASLTEKLRSFVQGMTEDGVLLLDAGALLGGDALIVDIPRRPAGRAPVVSGAKAPS